MKHIMLLMLAVCLVTPPVFGEFTAEELRTLERLMTTANEKQTEALKEYVNLKIDALQTIVATEISVVKADILALKADISAVKADILALKADVAAMKTENSAVKADVSFVKYWLTGLVTASMVALMTILLTLLKKSSDEKREHREAMAAQQAENAALRAENERLKKAPGLVSPSGERLESDNAPGG